jgi:hypothetical protein
MGASHLLLVSGSWRDGLSVSGHLISLKDGSTVAVGPAAGYNPIRPRTGPQVLGIMKWVARDAVAKLLAGTTPARSKPTPPGPAASVTVELPRPTVRTEGGTTLAPLGWTLVAVGAAAAAGSVWLFAIDRSGAACSMIAGDPEPCEKERRTIVPAVGVAIGAGAALLMGTLVLVRDHGSSIPQLAASVHPGGVTVRGRF